MKQATRFSSKNQKRALRCIVSTSKGVPAMVCQAEDSTFEVNRSRKSSVAKLVSSFPWEVVEDNVKHFKFIIMNYFTSSFSSRKVEEVAEAVESFINEYFYPSWRTKAKVKVFTPPDITTLENDGIFSPNNGCWINPKAEMGSFIPIYLVDEFDPSVGNNFSTAVHGNTSGTPVSGYNALLYLNGDDPLAQYGILPFGTPFIVIPAGSTNSGNGINAEIASNQMTGDGPTDFYQVFSKTLCHEMIEVIVNPTGAQYTEYGNPIGFGLPATAETNIQLLLKEAVDPFSQGKDNLYSYKGWTMTNFAYPTYFYSDMNVLSKGKAVYDFLGHGIGPWIPYKGHQFVIIQTSQNGVNSDVLVGNYVSPVNMPNLNQLQLQGSIYDYNSWGLTSRTDFTPAIAQKLNNEERTRGHMKGAIRPFNDFKSKINAIPALLPGRNHNGTNFSKKLSVKPSNRKQVAHHHSSSSSSSHSHHHRDKHDPQLPPFQYINSDGMIAQRFTFIIYSPYVTTEMIETLIPIFNVYFREHFTPQWKVVPDLNKKVYVINTPQDLPNFDGTFVPIFFFRDDQYDLNKIGFNNVGAGANDNVNNIEQLCGFGGLISENIINAPNLPLGLPYIMMPDGQFTAINITTDQPGLGPFFALPQGSNTTIPFTLPFTAQGAAAADTDACGPLPPGSMAGKIGINVRTSNCNSLVYPTNMYNAGAVASITVYSQPSGFAATGSPLWGCTAGSDAMALFNAVQSNPNINITLSLTSQPYLNILNRISYIITHEIAESIMDPLSDHILTGNPPVDQAIYLPIYENVDPIENVAGVWATDGKTSVQVTPIVNPSYFIPNLRVFSYDTANMSYASLIPQDTQYGLFHANQPEPYMPLTFGRNYGIFAASQSPLDLVLTDGNGVFDRNNVYPPVNPNEPEVPVSTTPWASIFDNLENLRNIFFI